MADCRLYLCTPPALDPAVFADQLAQALDAGDVACIQLRLKDVDDDTVRRAVDVLRPISQSRGVAFILNDRPDLAAETGCDGVHVGQGDASLAEARRVMGPDAMIGVTCHADRDLAWDAAEGGADYVAFGAFHPTATKATTHRPELDLLTTWQETVEVPCVAIGGITVDTAAEVARAGADFIAVSAGVWSYREGAAEAVKHFNLALNS